jgi:hypothetical protein
MNVLELCYRYEIWIYFIQQNFCMPIFKCFFILWTSYLLYSSTQNINNQSKYSVLKMLRWLVEIFRINLFSQTSFWMKLLACWKVYNSTLNGLLIRPLQKSRSASINPEGDKSGFCFILNVKLPKADRHIRCLDSMRFYRQKLNMQMDFDQKIIIPLNLWRLKANPNKIERKCK